MAAMEWVGFLTPSGYSQSFRDYITAIIRHTDIDVSISLIHGMADSYLLSRDRLAFFNHLYHKKKYPQNIQVFNCIPHLQNRVPRRQRTVGFGTLETSEPPINWVEILNKNDGVICPSRFCEHIFREAGVTSPIYRIPHCIDTATFNQNVRPKPHEDVYDGYYRFLYVGNWIKRKGCQELLTAFWSEFRPDDKVLLSVHTHNDLAFWDDYRKVRTELGLSEKDFAPVLLETDIIGENDFPSFLKSHDCLVFPTKGEGFGLPPMQCMAVGVPVICTNYSGCQEYLNQDTGIMLQPDGLVVYHVLDRIRHLMNKKWAHIPITSIRAAMRDAVENPDLGKRRAMYAAKYVAEKFGYEPVAKKIIEMMTAVGAE